MLLAEYVDGGVCACTVRTHDGTQHQHTWPNTSLEPSVSLYLDENINPKISSCTFLHISFPDFNKSEMPKAESSENGN
jgi:hypothetical protein